MGAVYSVDGINGFATLIAFPFDPVAIQIREETIDVVRPSRVSRPFGRIIPQ